MSAEDEIAKKAKLLAEATGRTYEDVLEDLLDDGQLNESNKQKADLVSQLKEAAELINTVQSISKEVSKNSVLNGGENKTEVKVESTLEGDIVDRAIASAQRKADNIKKLMATIIPLMLLITGGSMEAFGVIDVFGSEEDNYDPYEPIWGCTAWDAENYDPYATDDDGSCWWDNGGGGNDCEPDWWWKDEAIFDHDHNGQGYNNDLRVQVTFRDMNQCNIHMNNGYFEIMVGDQSRIVEVNFHDEYAINEHYLDLEAGDYYVEVDYYTYDDSSWNGPEAWVTMESEPCQMELVWKESNLRLKTAHSLEVEMVIENQNDCEGDVSFMFSLYHNNSYQNTVDYDQIYGLRVNGQGSWNILFEHEQWNDLGEGIWMLETRYRPEDTGQEACCWDTNKVEIKSD